MERHTFNYKKIAIIGPCGSGKTFLADQLAEIFGLPVFHMDDYLHKPGKWSGEDEREKFAETWTKEVASKNVWIIEGGYFHYPEVSKVRFQAAELIILLNMSREICIKGISERDPNLSLKDKEKMIAYMDRFEHNKPQIPAFLNEFKPNFLEFNTREQINEFLYCLIKQQR